MVAHIGELLLLDGVHVGVVRAVVLADDHAFVDVHSGAEEERSAGLEVVEGVGGADPGAVGDDGAGLALGHRAAPGFPAVEHGVQESHAARGGEKLAPEPNETTARDAVLEAGAAVAGVRHLEHASAA